MKDFVEGMIRRRARSEDAKSLQELCMKAGEELGEVNRAALIYAGAHGTAYRGLNHLQAKDALAEEIADVMICLTAIAERADIPTAMLDEWLLAKYEKWGVSLVETPTRDWAREAQIHTDKARHSFEQARIALWRDTFGGVPLPAWSLYPVYESYTQNGHRRFVVSDTYTQEMLKKGVEEGYLRAYVTITYFMPYDEDGDGMDLFHGWLDEAPQGEALEELWNEYANDGEHPYDMGQVGFLHSYVLQLPETA